MIMSYVPYFQLTVGKVNISITYLPTAEKLSVCIKEFTVDKELSQNMSGIYISFFWILAKNILEIMFTCESYSNET